MAAWYLITILDANVDASLSNFDVTNKLNVQVSPLQLPVPGSIGAGFNVSLYIYILNEYLNNEIKSVPDITLSDNF